MAQSVLQGDVHINGNFSCKECGLPAASIDNAAIEPAAGIDASKLEHQHQVIYAQNANADSAADRRVVHVVEGATGEIVSFEVGSKTACTGNSTITVDLLKNGSSILSAAVVLDNGNTAYVLETGTVSNTALVAGNVLEVNATISAGSGTLGDGVFASLVIREDAQ